MWTNAFNGLMNSGTGLYESSNPMYGQMEGPMQPGQQRPMQQYNQLGNEYTTGGLMGAMGKMGGGGGGGYGKMAYQQGLSSGPGGANDMSQYANIQSLMNMAMKKEPQQQRHLQNSYPHMRGLL